MQIGAIGIGVQAAWVVFAYLSFAAAADPKAADSKEADHKTVYGRVVDDQGKPVAGASVCWYWRANGSGRDAKRQVRDLSTIENQKEYWGRLGQMDVASADEVKSADDGTFSINVPGGYHALMAIDESRRRGGLAILPLGADEPEIEIRLLPLVKVKGRFASPEPAKKLEWTHVYVMLPDDQSRPLDTTRLAGCGSFEARFEMSLPPGRYRLYGYNDPQDAHLAPEKAIVLKQGMRELDLGVLSLSPCLSMQSRVEQSKAGGRWSDYKQHYGESPPRWHAVDARGVSKDVSIEDFEGKWVLLDFWGPSCRACMKNGMPKLISFYEQHARQREQFEILSICIDFEGDIKSMADLDRTLAPVIEHAWNGKMIPFPILLDSTFKTWERYGLPGLGTVLLVDPQGKLVPGDETELAKQLK
ncbi:MAG TPA: redoxin domain-containing protein [Pirellulales bacterium]|nr:redoxin domain-containing protein [Pirellulales bacterium]